MSITNLSMAELIQIITEQSPLQSSDLKYIFNDYVNTTFQYSPKDTNTIANPINTNINNNNTNPNTNSNPTTQTIQHGYTYVEKRF
jgi:hypothetical protein